MYTYINIYIYIYIYTYAPGTMPEETSAPMVSSTADSTGGLETQAASRTASECIDLTHDDDDHITIESDD